MATRQYDQQDLIRALIKDLNEMHASTAIDLTTWPSAAEFVSFFGRHQTSAPRLHEVNEHLCGYGLAKPLEPEFCYHEGCWADRDQITVAYSMAAAYRVDDESETHEAVTS